MHESQCAEIQTQPINFELNGLFFEENGKWCNWIEIVVAWGAANEPMLMSKADV